MVQSAQLTNEELSLIFLVKKARKRLIKSKSKKQGELLIKK